MQTELFIFWFWLISVVFYRRVSRDSKQVTINCLTPCCQGEGEPGNTFSSHNFKRHRAVAMWRSLVTGQRWVSRKPQLVSHLYGTCPLATSPFWNASKARKQKTVIKAACGHLHTLLGSLEIDLVGFTVDQGVGVDLQFWEEGEGGSSTGDQLEAETKRLTKS